MSHRHHIHFYKSGNLLVEARGTLFRIHQEKLFKHSDVFKDILCLPESDGRKGSSEGTKQIELHDDPVIVALLFDIIYQTTEISQIDVKEQLQLALLSNKYGMDSIQSTCQSCLQDLLPKDITARDFHQVYSYEDDPSVPPLVIRVGELLDMPDVLPWAVYLFAIQSEPGASSLSDGDIALRNARSPQLKEVCDINRQSIRYWDRSFTRFMRGYCSAEWWDDEDGCWRRSELLDTKKTGFVLDDHTSNSLRAIYTAVDTWSLELCSLCADGLTEYSNEIMRRVMGRISRDVLQL